MVQMKVFKCINKSLMEAGCVGGVARVVPLPIRHCVLQVGLMTTSGCRNKLWNHALLAYLLSLQSIDTFSGSDTGRWLGYLAGIAMHDTNFVMFGFPEIGALN
jgi:hypothetical protein